MIIAKMNFEIQGDIYVSEKVGSKRKTGKKVILVYWFTMNLLSLVKVKLLTESNLNTYLPLEHLNAHLNLAIK